MPLYGSGLGSWQAISLNLALSGTALAVTNLDGFEALRFDFRGVSVNTNNIMTIEASTNNGGVYQSSVLVGLNSLSSNGVVFGKGSVEIYNGVNFLDFFSMLYTSNNAAVQTAITPIYGAFYAAANFNAVRFAAAGSTFTAGNVDIWGVKLP